MLCVGERDSFLLGGKVKRKKDHEIREEVQATMFSYNFDVKIGFNG